MSERFLSWCAVYNTRHWMLIKNLFYRLSSGCRILLNWLHCETSRNGRRSVTLRVSPIVLSPTLALWRLVNSPAKLYVFSPAWNAPTTTPGFLILPETASRPNNTIITKSGFLFERAVAKLNHVQWSRKRSIPVECEEREKSSEREEFRLS
jgi:hypothetical protein